MSPALSSSPVPVDRLRPEWAQPGRPRRRMGLHPRRRGQRLLDRTGGVRAVLREADRRGPERGSPPAAEVLRNRARAGSDSRGLSRHSAAGRDRSARAVRSHRVQGRRFGRDRDSPSGVGRRAGVVGALGRSEAGPGGRTVSVRPRRRHVQGGSVAVRRARSPAAARLAFEPYTRLDVEPAIGAVRLALAGGTRATAHIPEYRSQIDSDQSVAGDVSREDVRGRSAAGKGARRHTWRERCAATLDWSRPADGTNPDTAVSRSGALHAPRPGRLLLATTFNLDEFIGLPSSHPGSYRTFMEQHLFSHVNLPQRINFSTERRRISTRSARATRTDRGGRGNRPAGPRNRHERPYRFQ